MPWPGADRAPRKWVTTGTWGTGPNVESYCSAKKLRFYPRRQDLMLKHIGERETGEEGRVKSCGTRLRQKKKKKKNRPNNKRRNTAELKLTGPGT